MYDGFIKRKLYFDVLVNVWESCIIQQYFRVIFAILAFPPGQGSPRVTLQNPLYELKPMMFLFLLPMIPDTSVSEYFVQFIILVPFDPRKL